jgi:hypothetical protein
MQSCRRTFILSKNFGLHNISNKNELQKNFFLREILCFDGGKESAKP